MSRTYQPPAITEESVYPNGYAFPVGQRVKDFRPYRKDEIFIARSVLGSASTATFKAVIDGSDDEPRIILEDIPAPRRFTITVEEHGGSVRLPVSIAGILDKIGLCPSAEGFRVVSAAEVKP